MANNALTPPAPIALPQPGERYDKTNEAQTRKQIEAALSRLARSASQVTNIISGSTVARGTVTFTTSALPVGGVETGSIASMGGTSLLLTITTDTPCWVRLYASPADQQADAARPITNDPTTPVLAEFILTAAVGLSVTCDPATLLVAAGVTSPGVVYYRLTRLSASGGSQPDPSQAAVPFAGLDGDANAWAGGGGFDGGLRYNDADGTATGLFVFASGGLETRGDNSQARALACPRAFGSDNVSVQIEVTPAFTGPGWSSFGVLLATVFNVTDSAALKANSLSFEVAYAGFGNPASVRIALPTLGTVAEGTWSFDFSATTQWQFSRAGASVTAEYRAQATDPWTTVLTHTLSAPEAASLDGDGLHTSVGVIASGTGYVFGHFGPRFTEIQATFGAVPSADPVTVNLLRVEVET